MVCESKSIPQGTATTIVCALDPHTEFGKYYEDCQVSSRVHALAFDENLAENLTLISHELIGKIVDEPERALAMHVARADIS